MRCIDTVICSLRLSVSISYLIVITVLSIAVIAIFEKLISKSSFPLKTWRTYFFFPALPFFFHPFFFSLFPPSLLYFLFFPWECAKLLLEWCSYFCLFFYTQTFKCLCHMNRNGINTNDILFLVYEWK